MIDRFPRSRPHPRNIVGNKDIWTDTKINEVQEIRQRMLIREKEKEIKEEEEEKSEVEVEERGEKKELGGQKRKVTREDRLCTKEERKVQKKRNYMMETERRVQNIMIK